jgi:hypothetical protein
MICRQSRVWAEIRFLNPCEKLRKDAREQNQTGAIPLKGALDMTAWRNCQLLWAKRAGMEKQHA